jgi:hypothetical protein
MCNVEETQSNLGGVYPPLCWPLSLATPTDGQDNTRIKQTNKQKELRICIREFSVGTVSEKQKQRVVKVRKKNPELEKVQSENNYFNRGSGADVNRKKLTGEKKIK